MAETTMRSERFEWLDVLRGIASFGVALFHAMTPLWVGLSVLKISRNHESVVDRVAGYLSIPMHYGYDGVMLFFVLSGFVIHLPYASSARALDFKSYLIRRFLRLYPPYVASIVLSVFVTGITTHVWQIADQTTLKSIVMIQNYPHGGGPLEELAGLQLSNNFALWSVPVEFELYVFYPVLLFAVRRFAMRRIVTAVVALSLVATIVDIVFTPARREAAVATVYFPTFLHYLVVWAAGAWLAERFVVGKLPRWTRLQTSVLVVAVILAALARSPLHFPREIEDYVAGLVAFMTVLGLCTHPRLAKRLTTGICLRLRDLGTVSYSLYLIHLPFFFFVAYFIVQRLGTKPSNYLVSALVAFAALPLAYLFYRLFERPSIALGRRLGRSPSSKNSVIRTASN